MEKPAPADHPINDLIRRRWSPRLFSAQPVDAHELTTLFEAARWAPSSYNEQPWSFIVATRDEPVLYEQLLTCLTPGNQNWAWHAPVLMLSVVKLAFDRNGNANRHAFHDVGQAAAMLSIQATAHGLFLHQMAGFDLDAARRAFAIPETHEPVAAIALGYPAEATGLGKETLKRESSTRSRHPIRDFVFSGSWGTTADFIR